jgi:hypothetical protein
MEFREESVDLTKEIIDKAINILLNTIPLSYISITLKNLLINKMNEVLKCFKKNLK